MKVRAKAGFLTIKPPAGPHETMVWLIMNGSWAMVATTAMAASVPPDLTIANFPINDPLYTGGTA